MSRFKLELIRNKAGIYIIPYLLLLALGAWYRYHIAGLVFLDTDSEHYLMPPVIKELIGQWHKGERPMQYLLFIYATLSQHFGIKYTIIAQQVLGIVSGALLAIAWIGFVSNRSNRLGWHLLGYMMLGIFIGNHGIMNYEQFIGPESICMCIMSAVICCLVFVFSDVSSHITKIIFASIAIFINLYLSNPMPKWVFVTLFLEVLLVYHIIKSISLSRRVKGYLIIVPHLFYALLVLLPESVNKIDNTFEGRVYIEYEQMAFTHFDLLAQDRTNFGLTPALQDSMILRFKEAQKVEPDFIIKFSSDNLMWGKANELINSYFHNNYDSIESYYIGLCKILVTKYPVGLSREIGMQVYAFYFPNKYIHKDMYNSEDIFDFYFRSVDIMKQFDRDIFDNLASYAQTGPSGHFNLIGNKRPEDYFLTFRYPASAPRGSCYDIDQQHLVFSWHFFFYRFFDEIFIIAMILFMTIRIIERKLFVLDVISLLYMIMFIYVLTIAIVHTFDIRRFIMTIYPFILITTCFAIGYIADYILNRLKVLAQRKRIGFHE